jgi:hypothetical protein
MSKLARRKFHCVNRRSTAKPRQPNSSDSDPTNNGMASSDSCEIDTWDNRRSTRRNTASYSRLGVAPTCAQHVDSAMRHFICYYTHSRMPGLTSSQRRHCGSSLRMQRVGPSPLERFVQHAYALFLATTRKTGNLGATCSNAASGASLSIGRCALAPGARCKYAFSTGARRAAATSSRCISSRRP